MEGTFQFEHEISLQKPYFLFRLLQLLFKLIGDNFCRQATWAGGRYEQPYAWGDFIPPVKELWIRLQVYVSFYCANDFSYE
jgi:hypothetical protein